MVKRMGNDAEEGNGWRNWQGWNWKNGKAKLEKGGKGGMDWEDGKGSWFKTKMIYETFYQYVRSIISLSLKIWKRCFPYETDERMILPNDDDKNWNNIKV